MASVKQLIEENQKKHKRRRQLEKLVPAFLFVLASISFITTISIIYVLVSESYHFFQDVSVKEFLTGTVLKPMSQAPQFGMLPLFVGTITSTAIALALAVPVGLLSAIYLSEYASKKLRNILKPILEVLAGIPTIV